MSRPAIEVRGLSKLYRIGELRATEDSMFDSAVAFLRRPLENYRRLRALAEVDADGAADDPSVLWALRDVSFDVREGDVLGVIGGNGAGKSTLLKVLSRITTPTRGEARIHGRVSSLLEVGTGFHPDLTGRENVFMNGTILGMTTRDVRARFEEIVEFSGVQRFIDTPVKWYSSGMRLRLAFSVAAHLDAPILVIDEVLAVGDASFQKKCMAKLDEAGHRGRTVLFVSHNLPAVRRLCTRAILMQDGRLRLDGTVDEVLREYLGGDELVAERTWSGEDRPGDEVVRLQRVAVLGADGAPRTRYHEHEPVTLVMDFACASAHAPPVSGRFALLNQQGEVLFLSVDHDGPAQPLVAGRTYRKSCTVPGHFLNEGAHSVHAVLADYRTNEVLAIVENVLLFETADRRVGGGVRGEHLKGALPGAVRPLLDWRTEPIA